MKSSAIPDLPVSLSAMKHATGFTTIELVMVIVILGILAAVVIPRMSGLSDFKVLAFHDQVVSALRHAQKTATSHRRLVCVAFSSSTVTLTIAKANSSTTCNADLILPGGNSNIVQSGDTSNAVFSPVPTAFFFQPDGRGTSDGAGVTVVSPSLAITGQTAITVVGASGYVQ